jgi:uncharacterized membrane protein
MEKQQLIAELKSSIDQGQISKNEILQILSIPAVAVNSSEDTVIKRMSLSQIFYYIGGIIVVIGLIVLMSQNWANFSYVMKVLVTFGVGLAFFISATLLAKIDQVKKLSTVFYFISGILIPFGYFVIFKDNINSSNVFLYNTLISFLCLLQFGLTQYVLRKDIFTIFNTIFATWFFVGLSNNLISNNPGKFSETFHLYQTFLVGLSYVLVGYHLKTQGRLFANLLDGFGILGLLGSGFALNLMASSTYGATASVVWILVYPVLLIASIISSVYLKSSSFLFIGTLFLIAYIIRLTSQYFSDTLGWPLVLILMGLVIMALGYLAFHLNKKYIKQ